MSKRLFWTVLSITVVFGYMHTASAVTTYGGQLTNPLACPTIPDCVKKITDLLLVIAAPIATIMALYGGFQMMTAGGEPEKFSNGRKTLLYAAIGFLVVLLADQVVPLVQSVFK